MRMRSRDIEQVVRDMGHEKGTVHCLIVLAEQHSALMQEVRETQQLVDKMADIVGNFVAVANEMKLAVDSMKGKYDEEDGTPH